MMTLTKIQKMFLDAFYCALTGEKFDEVCREESVTEEEWGELFSLAEEQNILPLVYDSVYGSRAYVSASGNMDRYTKRRAITEMTVQVMKTSEFLSLYKKLAESGHRPIVVKGIILRNLYRNPDGRASGDEDLFVPKEEFKDYQKLLNDNGLFMPESIESRQEVIHELLYANMKTNLRLELHDSLFDEGTSAFNDMNECFSNAFDKSIDITIQGVPIRTMEYTQHLLFLILHAYKHFLSGGFGLRQVADMAVFAEAYGEHIDWMKLKEECLHFQTEVFAASLFDIGKRFLGFDYEAARYPDYWQELAVDSNDLLVDLLGAGIFGFADMNRKHSSNMTIEKVNADREGKSGGNSVLKALFPSRKIMAVRYPYLKDKPYLLPAAWVDRIYNYGKGALRGDADSNAAATIEIGNKRLELLEKYKILRK